MATLRARVWKVCECPILSRALYNNFDRWYRTVQFGKRSLHQRRLAILEADRDEDELIVIRGGALDRAKLNRESHSDDAEVSSLSGASGAGGKSDKSGTFDGTPQEKSLAKFVSDGNGFQRNIGHTNNWELFISKCRTTTVENEASDTRPVVTCALKCVLAQIVTSVTLSNHRSTRCRRSSAPSPPPRRYLYLLRRRAWSRTKGNPQTSGAWPVVTCALK